MMGILMVARFISPLRIIPVKSITLDVETARGALSICVLSPAQAPLLHAFRPVSTCTRTNGFTELGLGSASVAHLRNNRSIKNAVIPRRLRLPLLCPLRFRTRQMQTAHSISWNSVSSLDLDILLVQRDSPKLGNTFPFSNVDSAR